MSKIISGYPILVTGSHRAGTTWVARILEKASGVGYAIPEPFSLNHRLGVMDYRFKNWFSYYKDEDKKELEKSLLKCMQYNYNFRAELNDLRTIRDVGRLTRDLSQFSRSRLLSQRTLIKDPLSILSLEWLIETFGVQPIVMVRHPAAFVSSLKKAQWTHPYAHFTNQPMLMAELSEFKHDIKFYSLQANSTDVVGQGILLWNIIYTAVHKLLEKNSGLLLIRHEDISLNPLAEFSKIFRFLGLDLSDTVAKEIARTTSAENITEARRQNHTVINSKENVKAWQRRLNSDEIARVKTGTRCTWEKYYSVDDWN